MPNKSMSVDVIPIISIFTYSSSVNSKYIHFSNQLGNPTQLFKYVAVCIRNICLEINATECRFNLVNLDGFILGIRAKSMLFFLQYSKDHMTEMVLEKLRFMSKCSKGNFFQPVPSSGCDLVQFRIGKFQSTLFSGVVHHIEMAYFVVDGILETPLLEHKRWR